MTKEELSQLSMLKSVLSDKKLTPLFQPIVSLKKQTIFGYEALIRGPSDSPLHSPVNLFNIAERHNLLAELDLLCRQVIIQHYGALGLTKKLFINACPAALLQDDYPHGQTLQYLKRAGISADQIVIELTEQYPIEDYQLMRDATNHYREMGFSIAIDDLGAGYSGLRTWSEIKPDYVKLDRHFLQNIHEDKQKRQFVQSVIDIAQSINCKVIGEGIEVRPEYLTAQTMDMQFAQGYYFARPEIKPVSSIDTALFEHRRKQAVFSSGRPRSNTLVSSLLTEQLPIHINDKVNLIGDRFQADTKLIGLPVVNNQYQVVGIVWRDDFMTMYASRYGRELFGRKPVNQFMDASPLVVETDLPLKKLSYQITSQEASHQHGMFIITENQRYKGVGSLLDLLRQITDMQITMARHANPLSGLPGNVPISEHIQESLRLKSDVVICYFDLDNFKPYNDIYGFEKGDRVIRSTAKIMTQHINVDIDFLGHVGGDDFIIIFESENWQHRCQLILDQFSTLYPELYSEKHLEDGGIHATDRYGNDTFYSLLSLSIGAVRVQDFESITTEADLAECATKAKSEAKRIRGNSLHILKLSECNYDNQVIAEKMTSSTIAVLKPLYQ